MSCADGAIKGGLWGAWCGMPCLRVRRDALSCKTAVGLLQPYQIGKLIYHRKSTNIASNLASSLLRV